MRFYDAAAIRAALPFDRLIPALRQAFIAGCTAPPRHAHELVSPGGGSLTSLIMPAWIEGRCYGVKVINIAPANAGHSLHGLHSSGLHSSYLLFDATTGVPLALMDGGELTARRTAAASALAASWLATHDARHLVIVGSGRIARLLLGAYRVVRPINRVTVWARSAERAEAVAAELRQDGAPAQACVDLQAAVRAADIVSCATLAAEPLVRGEWLRAGSHLDLIGSFTPAMREADDACFAGAALYLDDAEALAKSGDLIGPLQRGVFAAGDVRGTLASLARGQSAGRRSDDERTVFKSVGIALEDLAAAMLVWEGREGDLDPLVRTPWSAAAPDSSQCPAGSLPAPIPGPPSPAP